MRKRGARETHIASPAKGAECREQNIVSSREQAGGHRQSGNNRSTRRLPTAIASGRDTRPERDHPSAPGTWKDPALMEDVGTAARVAGMAHDGPPSERSSKCVDRLTPTPSATSAHLAIPV